MMIKLIPMERLRGMHPQAFCSWDPVQVLFHVKLEQVQFQARRRTARTALQPCTFLERLSPGA